MIKQNTKQLIFIVGPTAVGKTDLALALAESLQTVILSADSRQCYREMSIGTAKPGPEELLRVPHYFIDSHSINEDFSAGDFERQALILLDELFNKYQQIVVVGGSGLFVNALSQGLDDLPKAKPGVREKWNERYLEHGISVLQEELAKTDPEYFAEVDIHNPQRLIRALEVYESSGRPFSFFRKKNSRSRPFETCKYALNMDRALLYDRINRRVDEMDKRGLLEEVRSLMPYRNRPALLTVGYREVFEFIEGSIETWEGTLDKIKQNTRRYAKRQITWFTKDPETVWLDADLPVEKLTRQILENQKS